jgi:Flp pilus assembly protein TadG
MSDEQPSPSLCRGRTAVSAAGGSERGAVTAETALAVPSIVIVLLLAVWVLLGVTAQLRCLDAAHVAARVAARGESDDRVRAAAAQVAPEGAAVTVSRGDGTVEVRVSAQVRPFAGVLEGLPGLQVAGRAVAADEAAVPGASGLP